MDGWMNFKLTHTMLMSLKCMDLKTVMKVVRVFKYYANDHVYTPLMKAVQLLFNFLLIKATSQTNQIK